MMFCCKRNQKIFASNAVDWMCLSCGQHGKGTVLMATNLDRPKFFEKPRIGGYVSCDSYDGQDIDLQLGKGLVFEGRATRIVEIITDMNYQDVRYRVEEVK